MAKYMLVSFKTCPWVQRSAIVLREKNTGFELRHIEPDNRPEWFLAISPLGKTPVLKVQDAAIFESAVILEYLEDVYSPPMHPADPLDRADHRALIEVSSSILNDIAGFYAAATPEAFAGKTKALKEKFGYVEGRLSEGPYFAGTKFSLVDAVFGPVFRYFDVFDTIGEFQILAGKPKVTAWRRLLATRPSVRDAVARDYERRLRSFLEARTSHLSRLMLDAGGPLLGSRH